MKIRFRTAFLVLAALTTLILFGCSSTPPVQKPETPQITEPDLTNAPTKPSAKPKPEDDLEILKHHLLEDFSFQISLNYTNLGYNGISQETVQTYAKDGSFYCATTRSHWDHTQEYEETTQAEFYYRYEGTDLVCYCRENGSTQRSVISAKMLEEMDASKLMLVGPDGLLPEYLKDFQEKSDSCYTFRLSAEDVVKEQSLLSVFIQNAFALCGSEYDPHTNISIYCTLETQPETLLPVKLTYDFTELKPYVLSDGALSGEYAFDTDLMTMTYAFDYELADTISIPVEITGEAAQESS